MIFGVGVETNLASLAFNPTLIKSSNHSRSTFLLDLLLQSSVEGSVVGAELSPPKQQPCMSGDTSTQETNSISQKSIFGLKQKTCQLKVAILMKNTFML